MTDAASGRRFLRPPSTVSRKSHSFNAADKNKIKGGKLEMESASGIPHPGFSPATSAAVASGQSEWRSRSMNAKHGFTCQGNSSAMLSKGAKSENTGNSKSRLANSPHLFKVENSSKMLPSTGKQKLVKTKQIANLEKDNATSRLLSGTPSKCLGAASESSRTAHPAKAGNTKTDPKIQTSMLKTSKGKSGLVPPRTVSRSASNSSRSSTATIGSPDRKSNLKSKRIPTAASKSSGSVLGRLRKKGVPQTTVPNDSNVGVTLRQALSVKSPTDGVKSSAKTSPASSPDKQDKKGPTSKLTMQSFKGKSPRDTTSKMQQPGKVVNGSTTKQNPGVKFSTFPSSCGKGEKPNIHKSKLQSTTASISPVNSSHVKFLPENSDVIILNSSSDSCKRFSGEENIFRRDRIDVKNLKNLLVRPYNNAQNGNEGAKTQKAVSLNGSDIDLSDSDDLSKVSIDINTSCDEIQASAPKTSMNGRMSAHSNRSKQPNYESGIRNVQLPSTSEGRKPQKTATVAPFRRQILEPSEDNTPKSDHTVCNSSESKIQNGKESLGMGCDQPTMSRGLVNSVASLEERRKSAKGIADLRQNLEETMVSLRNSQLKNRLSDEFQRRISAQLDDEVVEEMALPEVPPPLSSNTGYRTTSAVSGLHTISHRTRSPKLHAGDSLGPGSYTSPRVNKYSSLQRNHPSHSARSVWKPLPDRNPAYKDETENISSVSSGDISEMATEVSADDISLSSVSESPLHLPKPAASFKKSSLAKNKLTTSIESLEKSSNSTSESTRSLSWKKTKSGSKSDSESKSFKKKAERKNVKRKEKEGSPAVGSRLAGADRPESPTSSPAPFLSRDVYSYRSLPRTKKLQHVGNNILRSNLIPVSQRNEQEGFVRSPALKLLLRSKASKPKSKPSLDDIPDEIATTTSSADCKSTAPFSATDQASEESNHVSSTWCGNGLETKNLHHHGYGLSMTATQSLPRRFCRKTGATTWSQSRSSANAAYSVPVTPDDIYSQNGSYIDSSGPYCESTSSFSNIDVAPQSGSFLDDRRNVSDWPLSRLRSSPAVAASSPNVAHTPYYGHKFQSHDLLKRRGSALSLGAPSTVSSSQISDESSIATARSFLYSLAQNEVFHRDHMVQEFEKSLSHLTSRLRELTTTTEVKDTELKELRITIEKLKQQQEKADEWDNAKGKLKKKPSCGSLSSVSSSTSVSSTCSVDENKPKKKRGWLKSSFKTAFGKSKSKANLAAGDGAATSFNSPPGNGNNQDAASVSSFGGDEENLASVQKLKEELRQKERKLTDIRLEALTSRHQLQHLQDTMNQMRSEMESLRKENEQLHQLGLSAHSLTSSPTFFHGKSNAIAKATDELKVKILVEILNSSNTVQHVSISTCTISKSVNWHQLDQKLVKIFVAYCQTVDPLSCLKLHRSSVKQYRIGDMVREIGSKTPELLPCGFLVGKTDSVLIKLRDGTQNSVDALAFQLLIDKHTAENYVSQVLEHRRVIITGPVGVGKTLLANQLAGYIASATDSTESPIYMDAKQKALSELQDFLQNIANAAKCNIKGTVIIVLDNLQNVKHPHKLLERFMQPTTPKELYVICVSNRELSSLPEFCQISCSNSSPPVQMYLARKLRRDYLEQQISQNQKPDNMLSLVITWLPKCWQHINDFLELHTGPEVTIGPRMFSSCPMDASSARVWFTDLWNFSVVPYVTSAIKRSQARKSSTIHWSDPTMWVLETMPWRDNAPNLHHICTEDMRPSSTESDISGSVVTSQSLGLTSQSSNASQSSNDPLLNMLMRLQEAANYDSDTNLSHDENFELSIDKALTDLGS